MKLALIGASGFVGSAILSEALARGHEVTGLVRHIEKLPRRPGLTPAKADVYKQETIIPILRDHDAVISAFNPGWSNPEIRSLFIAGTRNMIDEVKKSGVKRFVMIGGAGSLEIAPGLQLVDAPGFPSEYKEGALGAREALTIIRQEQELDWTFVSPAIVLVPGTRTGKYRIDLNRPVMSAAGESRISTADLAVAVLDEIENPRHIRLRFTVGY